MVLSLDEFLMLRHDLPVVDVRSEGEYDKGHIISAHNIPILNNTERIEVGTVYKQKGQREAILTGFRLVGPRLEQIVTEAEEVGKELLVYCWRGGMRSANFCQFMSMAKVRTHALQGGYKIYRKRVLDSFSTTVPLMVIGGYTGSGKSDVIRALRDAGEQVLDLEHMASHKGSVFGGLMMPPQPTTEQFQNTLFEQMRTMDLSKRIWIENESIAVGNVIPEGLWRQMRTSPIVEISLDKATRIQRLVDEYGKADPEQFLTAMTRITKKLGGQHFKAAREKLANGDMAAVMDILLTYYDKAYLNGLTQSEPRLKHRVNWDGVHLDDVVSRLINL